MATDTLDLRPDPASAWHAGELALQRSAGAAGRMENAGRHFVRSSMPEQHRQFFPLLPFVVLGAVDPAGDAWATLRGGTPGFVHAPDPQLLRVEAARDSGDPAEAGMEAGDAVGLLGLDPMTRRRNRLNGAVLREAGSAAARGFGVAVGQSFGNCPRYIHQRQYAFTREPGQPAPRPPQWLDGLDARAQALVGAADSFYVASYVDGQDSRSGGREVDVSHRGGPPGFVRLEGDGALTVPDFSGNLFFNTLGNFVLNPRAGLVFVDPDTGDLLQMTGRAEVLLHAPEAAGFAGAERLWRFVPQRLVWRPQGLPLRWSAVAGGGVA